MELSVPTNWDEALMEGLGDYAEQIGDIYGVQPFGPLGGGRMGYLSDQLSRKAVARHIRQGRDLGATFTWLYNAPCLGNDEYSKAFRKALTDELRWLVDVGVTGVTVTIPLLVEMIKQIMPQLNVRISVISHVDSLQAMRTYEDLGADEIALDFNINRELALLKKLNVVAKARLSLLANDLCLYRCGLRNYHYNLNGHQSHPHDHNDGYAVDYCFLSCHRTKIDQPVELLRSPWIRPRDLELYERETGIGTFKLAGRTKETWQILEMVKSYARGFHEGNLLDIMESTSRDDSKAPYSLAKATLDELPGVAAVMLPVAAKLQKILPKRKRSGFLTVLGQMDSHQAEELLGAYMDLTDMSKAVHLDGSKLDGLVAAQQSKACGEECDVCDVCDTWAERAITTDTEVQQRIVGSLTKVHRGIVDGSYSR